MRKQTPADSQRGGLRESVKDLALSAHQQFVQYTVATNKTQATDMTNNAIKRWNC
jgi:hypothetical protein